jgi:hypothetical protein
MLVDKGSAFPPIAARKCAEAFFIYQMRVVYVEKRYKLWTD